MSYKRCVVPQCPNSSIKTPKKLFISVPKKVEMRKQWLQLARRNPNDMLVASSIYFCEDHFDMEKDIKNFNQYKMGFSKRLLLADRVLPSKFNCQGVHRKTLLDVSTSDAVKRQMSGYKQECVEDTQPVSENYTRSTNNVDDTEKYYAVASQYIGMYLKETCTKLENAVSLSKHGVYEFSTTTNT